MIDSSQLQDFLMQRWKTYQKPSHVSDEDWITAKWLLQKIATETLNREDSEPKSPRTIQNAHHYVTSTETTSDTDKITQFIRDKVGIFTAICSTGFPFSRTQEIIQEPLRRTLECDGSILFNLLTWQSEGMQASDPWISEEDLNERFGHLLPNLKTSEIADTCVNFQHAYLHNKDNKSGYYLLWLIKQVSKCDYTIPGKDAFNDSTVTCVLSQFIKDFNGNIPPINTEKFIEILHHRSSRFTPFLYQTFLDQEPYNVFLNLTIMQLKNIPMDKWPSKATIIPDLLETISSKNKLIVTKALASSTDPATSEIGQHFVEILTACSLTSAIEHLYALQELLPDFTWADIQYIFHCPFIPFLSSYIYKEDPEFVRRVELNGRDQVFISDSLMIGTYDPRDPTVPSYLLAFDMNTKKMVWGLPLLPPSANAPSINTEMDDIPRITDEDYHIERVGNYLSLQFKGDAVVRLIHLATGEPYSSLKIPEISIGDSNFLHISPQGFTYHITKQGKDHILVGGQVTGDQWSPSFEFKAPNARFLPCSTHCGFEFFDMDNPLVLFGPMGDQVSIPDCIMAAQAHDGQLYTIEKDSAHEDTCLLNIRTLKTEHEVISPIETSISLNVHRASFGKLCHNGQLILFSQGCRSTVPIFVDLIQQQVTYGDPFYFDSQYAINADSGEIWIWDEISTKIKKISSTNTVEMGTMKGTRSTRLIHVDKGDHLYIADTK